MRCIPAAALAALIALGAPAAAMSAVGIDAGLRAPASAEESLRVARLSTFAIRDLLEAHGYRNIGKIKLSGSVYVVRATDRHGHPVKLYVDPSSARVIKKIIYK